MKKLLVVFMFISLMILFLAYRSRGIEDICDVDIGSMIQVRQTIGISNEEACNLEREEALGPYEDFLCCKWKYPSSNWPDLFPEFCGGIRQSPIDLASIETNYGSEEFVYLSYDHPVSSIHMENNGHLAFTWDPSLKSVGIAGGGLDEEYTLALFHFHWGCENNRGAEHAREGIDYVMEMHLVHYKSSYGSLEEAFQHRDGLAVLAVLFTMGDENAALKPITDNLPQISEAGTSAEIAFNVAIEDFLPSNKQTFYRYHGSLTAPTCNEVVVWSVFDTNSHLSQAQIDAFRSLKDIDNNSQCDNYRDFQPLNGRKVTLFNAPLMDMLSAFCESIFT